MKESVRKELPALVIIGCWFLAVAFFWAQAPDQIPTHMGFNGEVDDYGGKFEGLLLAPLISLAMFLFLLAIPYWDKDLRNDPNRVAILPIFRLIILLVMFLAYSLVMFHGLYPDIARTTSMPVLVGLSFILLGNFLGKTRPNKFIGIRTPWTFKSKLAWVGSNRVGGWLLATYGIALILVAFLWPNIWGYFLGLGALVLPTAMVGYSYYLFRNDPNPVHPFSSSANDQN